MLLTTGAYSTRVLSSVVVIFSIQGMNLTDLPTYRFPHQRFVFFEMEPPATTDYTDRFCITTPVSVSLI
jgi:hypothetical protein